MSRRTASTLLLGANMIAAAPASAYHGGKFESAAGGEILTWLLLVTLGAPIAGALVICMLLFAYGLLITNKLLYPRLGVVIGVSIGTWWVSTLVFYLTIDHLPVHSFTLLIGIAAGAALLLNYSVYKRQIVQEGAVQSTQSEV